jgi:tetratricopeptide (TPR) repeat protein
VTNGSRIADAARGAARGVARNEAHDAGFVDLVRDFLHAHRELRRIAARWRAGELVFADVETLVAGDEEAVLFRLKERCHALFRADGAQVGREALLDLAVGALFHECMKFRENFYQHAVYGPKVRALRSAAGGEAELFAEFEKILGGSRVRLEEALQEAEILLGQCTVELLGLLRARPELGLASRFMVERRAAVEDVFGAALEDVLASIHGSRAGGLEVVGRSYLTSGYYREAADHLRAALALDPARSGAERTAHYAEGMQAYLERDYRSAISELGLWLDAGPGPGEAPLASVALAAVSRIDQLVDEPGRREIGETARNLAERLRPLAPGSASFDELAT